MVSEGFLGFVLFNIDHLIELLQRLSMIIYQSIQHFESYLPLSQNHTYLQILHSNIHIFDSDDFLASSILFNYNSIRLSSLATSILFQ